VACDHDKLFGDTRDALGAPTPVLVDFPDGLDRETLRVLDVGCGQGRDAIFIARKGHRVVGVDITANGIRDLKAVAAREELRIELLERSLDHVSGRGWPLIADEVSNIDDFSDAISAHAADRTTVASRRGNLFLRRS